MNETVNSVIQEISELDDMYQGNSDHYFHVGQSALDCIRSAMHLAGKDNLHIKKILDFPCGYGRVLRVMKATFPDSEFTACDLERDGVDFCNKIFGATPVYSDKNIEDVKFQDTYDLIWVGSLFTHLAKDQWPRFIKFFKQQLNSGGILIFTTQGRYSASLLRSGESAYGLETEDKIKSLLDNYDNEGFGYSSYFHSDDYGISLSSPSYVIKLLEQEDDLRLLMCLEQGWDSHQDVIACIKD